MGASVHNSQLFADFWLRAMASAAAGRVPQANDAAMISQSVVQAERFEPGASGFRAGLLRDFVPRTAGSTAASQVDSARSSSVH